MGARMKVVSERSPEEIEADKKARQQARAVGDFERALVALTVNILRVTRGAGKAYEISRQSAALLQAMQDHWDAFGQYPGEADFHQVLHPPRERDSSYGPNQWRSDALDQIMRGSLQVVASRLARQRLQEAAGDDELHNGLNYYAEWREEMRAQRVAADQAARAAAIIDPTKPPR